MIKRCNDFGAGGVSVAIGELADGLEIEVHNNPQVAWSDGAQALLPEQFASLMPKVRAIRDVVATD